MRNEDVIACISGSTSLQKEELLQLCRKHLSAWQTPRDIWIVEEISRNERGKISRPELARIYVEQFRQDR